MKTNKGDSRWAIRPLVSEEVYTNREEHLEYLYNAAIKATTLRTMSTVLLGQRRMGKTEIFKRVVNKLFFGQDNYRDENASVVPVYYSFKDTVADRWDFSTKYVENFLRWYTAFRLRDPGILFKQGVARDDLIKLIKNNLNITEGLQGALNVYDGLLKKDVNA
ncbi:MAG: hypothetical protein LWW98_09650 [Deltaproteobacteria bacterium]|nr:hypothetical protein [Deltaproteobacteria bacterium]